MTRPLFPPLPYQALLLKRKKRSKIYRRYQAIGLTLAKILEDLKHKSLYIKLAKEYNEQELLALAKIIAQKKNVKNKGAYFMRIWKFTPSTTKKKKNSLDKKQLRLILRRTRKKKSKSS